MEESYGGCGDEKWKLSKKGRCRSGRAPRMMDAGDGSSMLSRSHSASVSSTRSGQGQQPHHQPSAAAGGSQSSAGAGLSKKCVEAVKEHRARFYIVRRCVSMLVCWRDH